MKAKRKKIKYTRKEVTKLIRFYCEMQRILCQLPVCSPNDITIKKEFNGNVCRAIRIQADIEKCGMPLEKENFERRLKEE